MNRLKKKVSPEYFFWIIMFLNIIVVASILILSKGMMMTQMGYPENFFGDYWEHVGRLLFRDKIYGTGDPDAIFPPLAYCIILLFSFPLMHKVPSSEDVGSISRSGHGTLFLVLFIGVFIVIFTQLLNCYYKASSDLFQLIAPLLFILSYPFWLFAFERGNITIYALVFLWFALANYKSENKVLRELAMISLSVAAGIKLYPALFGILWLKEKRYKEAARLVIYGLMAFLIPFPILNKGNVVDYISTFQGYISKGTIYAPSILGSSVKIFGPQYGLYIGYFIEALWIVWIFFLVFTRETNWKTITLLMSTQTIMIPEAYLYTYVYIVIACVAFLNETKAEDKIINYVYALFFASTFTIIPIGSKTGLLQNEIYISWVLILMIISLSELVPLVKKGDHGSLFRRYKGEA